MFDVDKFQKELFEEFYARNPQNPKDVMTIQVIASVSSKIAALAVEKYIKENCSQRTP